MYHCNQSAKTPWADLVRAPAPGQHPDSEFPLHAFTRRVCELVRDHDGPHTDWLGEVEPGLDAWVLWDDEGRFQFELHAPCGMTDPTEKPLTQEACTLPAGHALGHSWQFVDLLHD